MSISEWMNKSPRAVGVGVATALAVLLAIVWSQSSGGANAGKRGSLYYTTDDGKTTFVDAADKPTPFEVNGKTAVQAVMFSCPEMPKPFLGYLQRGSIATTADSKLPNVPQTRLPTVEIKRPGDAAWVPIRSQAGATIRRSVNCPGGTREPQIASPD